MHNMRKIVYTGAEPDKAAREIQSDAVAPEESEFAENEAYQFG